MGVYNYEYALIGGPWLIYDHHLTIKKWELDFALKDIVIENVAIWVRLLGEPITLYDRSSSLSWETKLDQH